MTNSSSNQPLTLLLPKLKAASDVRASDRAGRWDAQGNNAFENIASSLEYQSPGETKSVSSVPTMWARPLSMEMALHHSGYPIRSEMVEQWQGMLAAIALAEVRGFPLTAQLVELDTLMYEQFAKSLSKLMPTSPDNFLYKLSGKLNPWQDIYVFLWGGKPVGMSTPSTIVCPSEHGEWNSLPWWKDGQITSPHAYLNPTEKGLLWRWLENLRQTVSDTQYQGARRAVNAIVTLISDFRDSLGTGAPEQKLSLTDDPQFFQVPINRGSLIALNRPAKVQPKPSNIRLIPSRDKVGKAKDLLIVDPNIAQEWGVQSQQIWVHGGKTLASLNIVDLKSGRLNWKGEVEWLEPEQLFLPELVFIDQEEALPGVLFPKSNGSQPLSFNGERITPLIPLNPILLDYFTPEELVSKIQFQPVNTAEGLQVRVILDLPLAGLDESSSGKNYRLQKSYPLKETNALKEVPVLEVWPNIRTENWKEYYVFYYDGEHDDETFRITLPGAKLSKPLEAERGIFQMFHLEEFPEFARCQNGVGEILGLMLLKAPLQTKPTGFWNVGVDFGTSFTNIYVNTSSGNNPEPLALENLLLKITDTPTDVRIPVLFEYFIPDSFIPPEKPLPLSTVLTIRGSEGDAGIQSSSAPILDGRIHVPNRELFNPGRDWIKTNLKWSPFSHKYYRIFIKHLALHTTALAIKAGVKEIKWSLSYPSAFSRGDKNRYIKVWQDVTIELEKTTGVKHICPEQSDQAQFRTESLAIAQYFADQEKHKLVNTTCIDMGGGTSDISIWEQRKLVHQCSVQLAGRDIFSQFLAMNPKFQDRLFEGSRFGLKGLRDGAFNAKLDMWLRLDGDEWLKNKRVFVEEDADFQGLVRLTTIGMAGLYYYVGILLKTLNTEKDAQGKSRYTRQEITPVYIGGNGSRLLNWISEGGSFNKHSEINALLSRMLSKGSGFEDTDETTQMSQRPKDEVACGLVLRDTELQPMGNKIKDPIIAGEAFHINGQAYSELARMQLDEDDDDFHLEIPQLVEIPKFLYDFHVALRELDIEGVKPVPGYSRSADPAKNDKLWRNTRKELDELLQDYRGKSDEIRPEPSFVLGLKALLKALGRQWADS